MYILAIETTGPYCSVAIFNGEETIEIVGDKPMSHVQSVIPMVQDIMTENQVDWSHISHIAVSCGPGSFTGIRIGVTTGRALSQITKIPLIEVPTLMAFGMGFKDMKNQITCPIFNARRNQIYGGGYIEGKEVIKAGPYMLDEFLSDIININKESQVMFVGDGLDAYEDQIQRWALETSTDIIAKNVTQRAGYVALMAEHMIGNKKEFDQCINLDYNHLMPLYMRRPEAERNLEEKKNHG